MFTIGEARQADQRVWAAEPFVATTVRQLQGLSEKFDLPNAAVTELYVKTTTVDVFEVDLFF